MRFRLPSIRLGRRGAAAAEMALVAPLLVVIMFGSAEVAKFFWDEHVVLKSVRDGVRYASRQRFANMPCNSTATNEAAIKNVVLYGQPVSTGATPRLYYWTDPTTVTVDITCYANAGVGGDRVFDGIYTAQANVPIVKVSAAVPYSPIVGAIGVDLSGLNLNAYSQSTVFGL